MAYFHCWSDRNQKLLSKLRMNVVKDGSRVRQWGRARFIFYKSLTITYTFSTLRRRLACDLQTLPIAYNLSVCICFYSFSMGFKDLATIGRMSFVRSLQFGIALDTAHQFSPWCGSARPHRCITLSCWAWKKRKRKKINIQFSLTTALSSFDQETRPVRRRLQKVKDVWTQECVPILKDGYMVRRVVHPTWIDL